MHLTRDGAASSSSISEPDHCKVPMFRTLSTHLAGDGAAGLVRLLLHLRLVQALEEVAPAAVHRHLTLPLPKRCRVRLFTSHGTIRLGLMQSPIHHI
jgi:hypothetical protein